MGEVQSGDVGDHLEAGVQEFSSHSVMESLHFNLVELSAVLVEVGETLLQELEEIKLAGTTCRLEDLQHL